MAVSDRCPFVAPAGPGTMTTFFTCIAAGCAQQAGSSSSVSTLPSSSAQLPQTSVGARVVVVVAACVVVVVAASVVVVVAASVVVVVAASVVVVVAAAVVVVVAASVVVVVAASVVVVVAGCVTVPNASSVLPVHGPRWMAQEKSVDGNAAAFTSMMN